MLGIFRQSRIYLLGAFILGVVFMIWSYLDPSTAPVSFW